MHAAQPSPEVLEKAEALRRSYLIKAQALLLLAGVATLTPFLTGWKAQAFLLLAAILYFVALGMRRRGKDALKELLFRPLAESLGFRVDPEGVKREEVEDLLRILPLRKPDDIKTGDRTEGETPLPFLAYDLVLLQEMESGNSKDLVPYFRGTIFRFRLPFSLPRVVVVPEEGWEPKWEGLEPVRLEDPRWEKYYAAYGEDQTKARTLLTPRFMEALLQVGEAYGEPVYLATEGNELVVALPKADRFEPSLFRPVTPEAVLEYQKRSVRELALAEVLVRGLDLEVLLSREGKSLPPPHPLLAEVAEEILKRRRKMVLPPPTLLVYAVATLIFLGFFIVMLHLGILSARGESERPSLAFAIPLAVGVVLQVGILLRLLRYQVHLWQRGRGGLDGKLLANGLLLLWGLVGLGVFALAHFFGIQAFSIPEPGSSSPFANGKA